MVTLIENEIYWSDSPDIYIFKANKNGLGYKDYILVSTGYFRSNRYDSIYRWKGNIRLATPLEKHWLEECIKANKFIPLTNIKLNVIHELW